MQAFHVNSEKAAKALVLDAATAIYGVDDFGKAVEISRQEINEITALMRDLDPKDTLETLYAAQIIVCHMLGMGKAG